MEGFLSGWIDEVEVVGRKGELDSEAEDSTDEFEDEDWDVAIVSEWESNGDAIEIGDDDEADEVWESERESNLRCSATSFSEKRLDPSFLILVANFQDLGSLRGLYY